MENPVVLYYKYMLVLNAYQIVMATQQDISARHCVIIQLPCCDEEAILKYLYEHVHVYSWILREDKETEMVRLCVWWREIEYEQFSTSPLRSFLKWLKKKQVKTGKEEYEKMSISRTLTTNQGVHALCNGDLQCISKYYTEGLLYKYLREVLSLELSQKVESFPTKEKCNHILQMTSSLDMSTKLDLLQKFTSTIVPQVKRELDFYQWPPEEKHYILPNPPSPLIPDPGNPPSPLIPEPGNPPSPLIPEPGTPEHYF